MRGERGRVGAVVSVIRAPCSISWGCCGDVVGESVWTCMILVMCVKESVLLTGTCACVCVGMVRGCREWKDV